MSNAARPLHCSAQMFVKWTQRLTLTLLLLAGSIRFYGQCPPPGFRQYTADNGLPSSEVYDVLQDRQGYLWFSSDNGVSRFNGFEFKNFGAVNGLAEPVVFNLREDHLGRIWMQSLSGNLFYCVGDTIMPFYGNRWLAANKQFQTMALGFFVDSIGQVFISLDQMGLLRFPNTKLEPSYVVPGQQTNLVYLNLQVPMLVSNQFPDTSCVEEFRNSTLALIPSGKSPLGLISAKGHFNFFLRRDYKHDFLNVYKLHDGHLLVSRSNYLYCFKDEQLLWERPFPFHIISLLEDSRGYLYLGLNHRNGVRVYRNLQDITKDKFERRLEGYSVTHVLRDRDGGMWFTTNEAGVFYLPNPQVQIFNQQTGFPFGSVNAIAEASGENELYVGFDGGGIVRFDLATKKVSQLPSLVKEVDDLYFDKENGTLWAAGSALLQDFRNGSWHITLDTMRSAKEKNIYGFAGRHLHKIPGQQQLWASSHAGFVMVDLSTFGVPSSMTDRSILQNNFQMLRTFDMFTNLDGRTFVSNTNGLFELKGNTLERPPLLHPSFLGRIEAMQALPDSTVVLGTKGYGLVFWKNGKVASLTEQDGLTANMVENLHVDAQGQIWAGTLNGLNRVMWSWHGPPIIRNITTAHGLPSNEINDLLPIGDKLWVATVGGLAFFDGELPPTSIPPKPIIEAVWVNEKQRFLPPSKQLELGSKDRNLRIKIASLQYANTARVLYRYRLHPDQAWALLNGRNLNLAALANGDYHLEIQARNADLIWSNSTHLYFEVPPLWWQSLWFIIPMSLCLLSATALAFSYRTNQIRQHKDLQKQVVELEYSALQAQMNPHFIFNCLNAIQHFIVLNEKHAAIEYLNSFAHLVRGMLNASVSGHVTLVEEIKLLENYLLLEQMRFNHRFSFEVKPAPGLELQLIKIPPLLIQPYVENAVLHGIADKASGGKVEVSLDEMAGYLIVKIKDNGKGNIHASASHDRSFHKSVGMSITGRRLQLLSGHRCYQAVETSYLEETDRKPIGTQVIVRIKIDMSIKASKNAPTC
ncbi:MAG: histidine kinase [Saprospiraceae bacterium]|nr:histidine kinase [Saprospiraceae bacterium]